jgi:hypothetical protein
MELDISQTLRSWLNSKGLGKQIFQVGFGLMGPVKGTAKNEVYQLVYPVHGIL